MRDRSEAALAAARAVIDKLPQYRGKNDGDPYTPGQQAPMQQSIPPMQAPQSGNPFEQAILNAAHAEQMQGGQGTQFAPPPMDEQSFMLMKLYHLLSGLSYELYGDPNKWQGDYVEVFFDELKTAIKRGKSLNTSKMKAMMKRK